MCDSFMLTVCVSLTEVAVYVLVCYGVSSLPGLLTLYKPFLNFASQAFLLSVSLSTQCHCVLRETQWAKAHGTANSSNAQYVQHQTRKCFTDNKNTGPRPRERRG